jgi:hypothetical protein
LDIGTGVGGGDALTSIDALLSIGRAIIKTSKTTGTLIVGAGFGADFFLSHLNTFVSITTFGVIGTFVTEGFFAAGSTLIIVVAALTERTGDLRTTAPFYTTSCTWIAAFSSIALHTFAKVYSLTSVVVAGLPFSTVFSFETEDALSRGRVTNGSATGTIIIALTGRRLVINGGSVRERLLLCGPARLTTALHTVFTIVALCAGLAGKTGDFFLTFFRARVAGLSGRTFSTRPRGIGLAGHTKHERTQHHKDAQAQKLSNKPRSERRIHGDSSLSEKRSCTNKAETTNNRLTALE